MDSGCTAPALSLDGPAVQVCPPLQPPGPTGASTGLQALTPHLLPPPSHKPFSAQILLPCLTPAELPGGTRAAVILQSQTIRKPAYSCQSVAITI